MKILSRNFASYFSENTGPYLPWIATVTVENARMVSISWIPGVRAPFGVFSANTMT
jgi:hypothetical protein